MLDFKQPDFEPETTFPQFIFSLLCFVMERDFIVQETTNAESVCVCVCVCASLCERRGGRAQHYMMTCDVAGSRGRSGCGISLIQWLAIHL